MAKLQSRSGSAALFSLILLLALACLPSLGRADNVSDAFFKAVRLDGQREIKSLLAKGVNPNLIDKQRGETGLMVALQEDSMKVFGLPLNARGVDLNLRAQWRYGTDDCCVQG
ncbi:hypothetical protein [Collimonas sp.]|jgi:hypothetical protein|uniref:hypothetical protein n=1 Tax=Collimonas sp. TaxID=1963772 RepID=UPI0037C0B1AF